MAHILLRSPNGPFKELVKILEDEKIKIKTIAISAPMTTLKHKITSDEVEQFLCEKVEPDMCNIFCSADVVPREYSSFVSSLTS